MKVLIACELSAVVRDEFRKLGHDAWSCDIEETEGDPRFHIKGDVLKVLTDGWDLMIAHPECRYLCVSGWHWNGRRPGREELSLQAFEFANRLYHAPIEKIAIENPVGILSRHWGMPQYIQPYQFGEDASKKTGLWLKNLPPLVGTKYIPPRLVVGADGKIRKRWSNQTDSGQNKLTPGPNRSRERARTYKGIAEAMAAQWGNL